MEADLKRFDARLEEEKALMAAEHSRRRSEFVRQLQTQQEFAARQQQALAERCEVTGTAHQGHAEKCESCDLKSRCSGTAAEPAKTEEAHKATPPPAQSPSVGCGVAGTEAAGKADKCAGCSKKDSCGSGKTAQATQDENEIAMRMSFVEHKILVLSGKGGVGKSMVSAQLAYALAERGFLVGLLDVDICGPTVPKMMGKRKEGVMRGQDGLAPVQVTDRLSAMSIGFLVEDENEAVIWRGPRKIGLIQTFLRDVSWGALDFLIVDTPPGTSDEHLSTVQMLKNAGIDGAVVVTSPQDVSVIEVGKEINFCDRMGVKTLGVIENFSDFACPLCSGVTCVWPATSGGGRKLAADHKCPFLGSVPLDPALARLGDSGTPVPKDSATGKVIYSIADQIASAVGAYPSASQ